MYKLLPLTSLLAGEFVEAELARIAGQLCPARTGRRRLYATALSTKI